ncbi:MAG: EthD domain-containing protein [Alphaproteobacteria bacterium]
MSGPTAKTIGFMPRRADISRADFRAYYETRHAVLAAPLFPFRRYRRNHLVDQAIEPGFDCISEFWVGSLEKIGELMAGEVGDIMRADERNFLDQPNILAVRADPVATGSDSAGTLALLVSDGGDTAALANAARAADAGLDLLSPLDARPSPCDAILRFDGALPALPEGWRVDRLIEVIPCETDPAQLQG